MDKPIFWSDEDVDWLRLINSQTYGFLKQESESTSKKPNLNRVSRETNVQDKKSDQSFNSDSPESDSPESMSSCLYVSGFSPPEDASHQCFYLSPSDESFLPGGLCRESDLEYPNEGDICLKCGVRLADTCIAHYHTRHFDICMTCASRCFESHKPCPLCNLPILYIYRYDNI